MIAANRARLEQIRGLCLDALREPAEVGGIFASVAAGLGVEVRDPVAFLLAKTTVWAALAACQAAGLAVPEVCENRLVWRKT